MRGPMGGPPGMQRPGGPPGGPPMQGPPPGFNGPPQMNQGPPRFQQPQWNGPRPNGPMPGPPPGPMRQGPPMQQGPPQGPPRPPMVRFLPNCILYVLDNYIFYTFAKIDNSQSVPKTSKRIILSKRGNTANFRRE